MKILITEKQLKLLKEFETNVLPILNRSMSSYKVEMVSLESLEDAYGEDRNIKPIMIGGVNHSENNIKNLAKDIMENGFKEPIILAYDPEREVASTIEGNHRIETAKRLGYKEVPVKLEIMRIRYNSERQKDGMFPLKTHSPTYTYMKKPSLPSDLGYDGRPIKDTDYKQ